MCVIMLIVIIVIEKVHAREKHLRPGKWMPQRPAGARANCFFFDRPQRKEGRMGTPNVIFYCIFTLIFFCDGCDWCQTSRRFCCCFVLNGGPKRHLAAFFFFFFYWLLSCRFYLHCMHVFPFMTGRGELFRTLTIISKKATNDNNKQLNGIGYFGHRVSINLFIISLVAAAHCFLFHLPCHRVMYESYIFLFLLGDWTRYSSTPSIQLLKGVDWMLHGISILIVLTARWGTPWPRYNPENKE